MYVCAYPYMYMNSCCAPLYLACTPTPYSTLSHSPQYLPHMFCFCVHRMSFLCVPSSYGPNGGSCTACPTAKPFSEKGSTSSDACIATCSAGFTGSVPCTACPAGKYKVFFSHTSTPTISHYHVLT